MVKNFADDSVIDTIAISQNEDGVDAEDRIQKLKTYLGTYTINQNKEKSEFPDR